MHEIFFENLRNPARDRRAGAMRQFPTGQLESTRVPLNLQVHLCVLHRTKFSTCKFRSTSENTFSNLVSTVALTKFASSSLPVKVHLKKNPEAEKLDSKE